MSSEKKIIEFNKYCDEHNLSHVWFGCKTFVVFNKLKQNLRVMIASVVSNGTDGRFKLFSYNQKWYTNGNKVSEIDHDELGKLLNNLKSNISKNIFREIDVDKDELKVDSCTCSSLIEMDAIKHLNSPYIPQSFIVQNEECTCNLDRNKSIRQFIEKK